MNSLCFNPHTHAGCDLRYITVWVFKDVSIHTPTQGVTVDARIVVIRIDVSIHTPTQGVTVSLLPDGRLWTVSIHTPTQGVT